MKHKKYLISSIVLMFILPILFASSVNATDGRWTDSSIFASNFNFDVSAGGLGVQVGNKHLDRPVESTGVNTLANGDKEFTANIYMAVESNLFTTYSATNILPNSLSSYEQEQTVQWLAMQTYDSLLFGVAAVNSQWTYYDAVLSYYSRLDFQADGFDGYASINSRFVDFAPSKLDFSSDVFTFDASSFTGVLKDIDIIDSQIDTIGHYLDVYEGDNEAGFGDVTDLNTAHEVTEDLESETPTAADYGEATGISQWFVDHNIGITRYQSYTDRTASQSASVLCIESVSDNKFRVVNKPGINVKRIQYTGNHGTVEIDIDGSNTGVDAYSITPINIYHNVGWHVYNYNINVDFIVKFEVKAVGEIIYNDISDGEELGLPDYQLEDMFWDLTMTGDTSGDLLIDTTTWWTEYWWLISLILMMLGIVVFLLLYFATPIGPIVNRTIRRLLKRKRRR